MSNPNFPSQAQNDARYATPANITSAIAAQATTDSAQYSKQVDGPLNALHGPQTIDRTGATDTSAALQAAIDAAAATVETSLLAANNDSNTVSVTRDFYIPAGEYLINTGLILRPGLNLKLSSATKIKAGASMGAMLDSSGTILLQRAIVEGGIWDCNGFAQTAIYLRWGIAMTLRDFRVNNPTQHAVIIGDPSATSSSYEITLADIDMFRPRATASPTGYYGIWMQNVTDSYVERVIPRGFDVGVRNDGGNNSFFRVHPWSPTGVTGPTICFDENGSNSRYIDCYADSPSGYGWRIRGSSFYDLTNCTMYMSASGTDNAAYGIYCDATPNLTVVGGSVYGSDSSHRWKQDIFVVGGASSSANIKWLARSDASTNVTRNYGTRYNVHALSFNSGSDAGSLQFNGAQADMIRGYNASSAQVFTVTKDGGVTTGNGAALGSTLYSGTGAPALGANYGDVYLRKDTATTTNQRIYMCNTSSSATTGAWTALV